MATNQPTNLPDNKFHFFDFVATKICDTFNPLIDQLIARRDALLTKLQTMKDDFVVKETTRIAAIKELERVIEQMQQASIKVNLNLKAQEEAIKVYRSEMRQHETPTKFPCFFFSCPTLYLLQTQVSEFGDVIEGVDYSLKKQPVLAVGMKGKANNELDAAGLALDEPNQLIYIADCGNSRIQVVSFTGNFLKRFGQGIIKRPWGISVTEDFIFVTDCDLHALLQFNKKDCMLVKRTGTKGAEAGQLKNPRGLCIDYNGDVYVADCRNNRVAIFSKELKFLKNFAGQQLKTPRDVKVTPSSVVVLDCSPNCLHFYSRSGDLLKSCITQGFSRIVVFPSFFYLDSARNILISDSLRNDIKIFSPSGQLIHTIGQKGNRRGELYSPYGICVSESGTIFAISENSNYCLQSF